MFSKVRHNRQHTDHYALDEYWQKAVDQTEAMLEAIALNMEKVAEARRCRLTSG